VRREDDADRALAFGIDFREDEVTAGIDDEIEHTLSSVQLSFIGHRWTVSKLDNVAQIDARCPNPT